MQWVEGRKWTAGAGNFSRMKNPKEKAIAIANFKQHIIDLYSKNPDLSYQEISKSLESNPDRRFAVNRKVIDILDELRIKDTYKMYPHLNDEEIARLARRKIDWPGTEGRDEAENLRWFIRRNQDVFDMLRLDTTAAKPEKSSAQATPKEPQQPYTDDLNAWIKRATHRGLQRHATPHATTAQLRTHLNSLSDKVQPQPEPQQPQVLQMPEPQRPPPQTEPLRQKAFFGFGTGGGRRVSRPPIDHENDDEAEE